MRKFFCFLMMGFIALIQLPSYVAAGEIDYSKPFPLSLLEYPISDAPYDPWTIILDVDNIQVNSDHTTQVQNEEMVCINPTNTANAVAIWRDFREGYRRVGVGYTFDAGQTWHDTLLYVPPHPRQSDPVLTVDDDGTYYACTLTLEWSMNEPSGIYIQKSTDGGMSWSDPYIAIDSVQGVFEDKQWMTLDRTSGPTNGNIYISWTRFSDITEILLVTSTDGSETYSDPVAVSDEYGVQWSVPTVGAWGDVFVAWFQYYPTMGIFLDVSSDQGQTFGQDMLLVRTDFWPDEIGGGILVFSYPALNSDVSLLSPYMGNLYIAFMDENVTDMDIFFMKSEDNGASWSEPIRLNDDPEHNGADQFHPWITVDETGVIHAIFYDRRLDENNRLFDVYYTRSDDAGETWLPNERITTVSSSPSDASLAGLIGEYIGLDAWQGEVQMVWTDTRNGNQDVFSGRMSPTGIEDDIVSVPHRLRLQAPYPNPFNASVGVSFRSAEEASVKLEIVDILGRKTATLFDGVCRTGLNRFVWDGTDMTGGEVASGTYFVRMSGSDGVQVKKAVLLR
jgi:hypothetical protein